jgi:peptide/nickel transport system substrate-binding protein
MRTTLGWRRAALLVLVLALAGCAGSQEDPSGSEDAPLRGGTLRILDSGSVADLDSHSAYTQTNLALMRLYVRTLYSWDSGRPPDQANQPVPDIAAAPPEVSGDGLNYTFKLRAGVRYGPPMEREVTARDFVYAVERQLDERFPSPNSYSTIIKGVQEVIDGRARRISGMRAVDDSTLQITLTQPANDFLSILALPFFAPVPEEHASNYDPGPDYSKAYVGAGPYRLQEWKQGKSVVFTRNPNWDPATDPLRTAHVDRVEVRESIDRAVIQQMIEADDGDLSLDASPPAADLQRLVGDPTLSKRFTAPIDGCARYLTLQTDNGPTAELEVRQAVNLAIDKEAIVRAVGGSLVAEPATTILPPTLVGYQRYDLYPTPNHRGDPDKAKQLLAAARYPDGVTINVVSDASEDGQRILTSMQASLGRADIRLKNKSYSFPAILSESLMLPSKAAEHQIGQSSFCPDYPGNGARSFFGVLLDGRNINPQQNPNFGNYDSATTNRLIDKALAAPDVESAAAAWAEADKQAMRDAAWVPLTSDMRAKVWSERVRNYQYSVWVSNGDLANLWLNPTSP